jgi:hypothetical protein
VYGLVGWAVILFPSTVVGCSHGNWLITSDVLLTFI